MTHKQYIEKLIIQSNLTDAIEELLTGTEERQERLYSKLINMSARNYRNITDFLENIITREIFGMEEARITKALNSYLIEYNNNPNVTFDPQSIPNQVDSRSPQQGSSKNPNTTSHTQTKRDAKPTVFISYNHKDRDLALNISQMLKDNEIEVIIDRESNPAAGGFNEFSAKAVKESDFTLLILSENSLFAPWVMLEVIDTFAHSRFEGKNKLIPVRKDKSFMRDEIVDKGIENLNAEMRRLRSEIADLYNNDATDNVKSKEDKFSRLKRVKNSIGELISHLRQTLVINVGEGNAYIGIQKVIKKIKEEV